MTELEKLTTEGRNPASEGIDRLSARQLVRLINAEDAGVAEAVGQQADAIARTIDAVAERLRRGGRLIYLGAGTSGRLGVLDAAECPPTFSTPPEQVVGLIAGGAAALVRAIEGAEDRPELAAEDLGALGLTARDVVVGIATSGRTPYVLGGLEYAVRQGALRIGLSCNPDPQLAALAEISITPVVGPEVISGSTRMKAGTATKMVLNMLSTGVMVLLGKTYGNLMVDLRATNRKLRDRVCRIVVSLTGLSEAEAQVHLEACGGELKTAIVSRLCAIDPDAARRQLDRAQGHLRRAIAESTPLSPCGRGAGGEGAPVLSTPVGPGPSPPMAAAGLVLGIDGGGTKTAAWLARRETAGPSAVCGRGTAGGANPQSIGFAQALENLDRAVAAAFADAGIAPGTVAAAVLALAGSARPENRETLHQWAERRQLARRFSLVSDAIPVLAASGGWGVALIAGTGSFALGRTRDGRIARAGGWGYLFGDEGSAYAIALAGLRAAARSADGRQKKSALLDAVLARLGLTGAEQLVTAVYRLAEDRSAIASLAEVVFDAAGAGDPAARQIVAQAAEELAAMVAAVVRQLGLDDGAFPLALAGGPLAAQPELREEVQSRLLAAGIRPDPVTMVAEPVEGAVLLAQAEAAAEPQS